MSCENLPEYTELEKQMYENVLQALCDHDIKLVITPGSKSGEPCYAKCVKCEKLYNIDNQDVIQKIKDEMEAFILWGPGGSEMTN